MVKAGVAIMGISLKMYAIYKAIAVGLDKARPKAAKIGRNVGMACDKYLDDKFKDKKSEYLQGRMAETAFIIFINFIFALINDWSVNKQKIFIEKMKKKIKI